MKLYIVFLSVDKDCGGTILPNADGVFDGYIQSPNYGFNYFPNLDCLWLLDASGIASVSSINIFSSCII